MQQNQINAGDLATCGLTTDKITVGSINHLGYTGAVDIKAIQAALPKLPAAPTYPIVGARTLTQEEINLMNEIARVGEEVNALINRVRELHMQDVSRKLGDVESGEAISELKRLVEQGQHWRMRAVDDLQAGFMKLKRSVARPTSFA